MPRKPFAIIAERLGEILELCRDISGRMPNRADPRSGSRRMLAVVSRDESPTSEREYVIVPDVVSVGDVVAWSGWMGIKTAVRIGIVQELYELGGRLDCTKPGTAYAYWEGPMIPIMSQKKE